ncbi:MAG: outer membrane protein assembly factor BamE [Methylophilales bacterium]|nr:outer membrane protein assembly factor BamE [Methylophilales bacterium]
MRYVFILLFVLCTSCGTALPTIKPYKLDVQQGNVVTSKMLLQLRPGMTKSQVRFIMGTPLIQDSFHGNRWDYAYQLREGGKLIEQRRVILDFQSDLLKTVRGDVVAATVDSKGGVEGADTGTRLIEPAKKPEEKSLMQKLKFWQKDEAEQAKEAADAKAKSKASADEAERAKAAAEAKAKAKASADEAMKKAAEAERAAAKDKVIEPLAVEPTPEVKVLKPVPVNEPAATSAPAPVVNSPSPSGLKIDKSLSGNAPESKVEKEVATPSANNAGVPKAKELPAENEPGFFDKMLEKIGF